jgi:subtilisin family serine protease
MTYISLTQRTTREKAIQLTKSLLEPLSENEQIKRKWYIMGKSKRNAKKSTDRFIKLRGVESMEPRNMLSVAPIGDLSSITDSSYDSITSLSSETGSVSYTPEDLGDIHETYGFTGAGQTVVVIDSGVAYDHQALGEGFGEDYRIVGGYDFTGAGDDDPYDEGPRGSHGTHVTGIIASDDPTHIGVAPGVDIVALRVVDGKGNGTFEQVELALDWVLENLDTFENPITTINMSLGTLTSEISVSSISILEDELEQLEDAGIFTAVAAGNQFVSTQQVGLSYPAVSPYVVPVASVDPDGSLSYFSQRSENVIATPGRSVESSIPDYRGDRDGLADDYGAYSGTSMSAPYLAGASLLIREAYSVSGIAAVDQDMIYGLITSTADMVYDSITDAEYYRLNLTRAIETVLAEYNPVEVPATVETIELGAVTQTKLGPGEIAGGGLVYQTEATHSGIFTVEIGQSDALDVQIVDSSGNPIEVDSSGNGRFDFEVEAGQAFSIRLGTTDDSAVCWDSLRLTNLAQIDGDLLSVFGTEGDDLFFFSAGDGSFSINGVEYQLADQIDTISFDGGGGNDRAELVGTAGVDTVRFQNGTTIFQGGSKQATVSGVEKVTIDGTSGDDALLIYGTSGQDSLSLAPNKTEYSSSAFELTADSFNQVYARLGAGADQVRFGDSAGDDQLIVTTEYAKMTGTGFYLRAEGAQKVSASSTGGDDKAYLLDSTGDDILEATQSLTTLKGTNYQVAVEDFAVVLAYSTSGGADRAIMTGTEGQETVLATGTYGRMVGDGWAVWVNRFEQLDAYSGGGDDRAVLYDSPGNDLFRTTIDSATLRGTGFENNVHGFEQVTAYATYGGFDRAEIYGTADDETLYLSSDLMKIYSGQNELRLNRFDQYYAETGEGNDRAIISLDRTSDSLEANDRVIRVWSDIASELYGIDEAYATNDSSDSLEARLDCIDLILQLIGQWDEV